MKNNEIGKINDNVFRSRYNVIDSVKTFFYSLIIPEVVIFVASILGLVIVRLSGGSDATISGNVPFLIFLNVIGNLALLVYFVVYVRHNKINALAATKISRPKTVNIILAVGIGIAAFAGAYLFVNYLSYLFGEWFNYHPSNEFSLSPTSVGSYIGGLFALVVVPVFVEEIIYRGVVFVGLTEKFNAITSILLSSFIFMIIHNNLNQTVYQFLLGLVITIVVYYTGNLVYGMVIHFTNNFISLTCDFILNMTGTKEKFVLNFTDWKIVLIAFGALIVGAGIVALLVYVVKRLNAEDKLVASERNMRLSKTEIIYLVIAVTLAVILWIVGTISSAGGGNG